MNSVNKENMRTVENEININELVDIRNIEIDSSLPPEEKKRSYLEQIKNPYLYRCGNVVVRVSFNDTGATLEERLKQILLSRQGLSL